VGVSELKTKFLESVRDSTPEKTSWPVVALLVWLFGGLSALAVLVIAGETPVPWWLLATLTFPLWMLPAIMLTLAIVGTVTAPVMAALGIVRFVLNKIWELLYER
jgi:hypothetical protein